MLKEKYSSLTSCDKVYIIRIRNKKKGEHYGKGKNSICV